MKAQEVGIKFELRYTQAAPLAEERVREINGWRKLLHRVGLIGQDPARYDGYGYGNISFRLPPFGAPPDRRPFVISGSQTGGLADLTADHYATVVACRPEENLVVAEGPIWPSSESLTHGTIYALDERLRCVIHAHSPVLWRGARALGLPVTHAEVPYGSPEMAEEVRRLFRETAVEEAKVFAMGGHEDGVIAFGRTPEEAGTVLLACLARAFAL